MRHLAHYLIAVMLITLTGCATTPPSRFYILSAVSADTAAPPAGPAIGVGPVEMPRYLDRPQIAVRSGANELLYNETHRWAEELKDNVTDVLAENLARLVPTDRVTVFPWGRMTTIDYQVIAEISRFDTDTSGNVALSANWKIYREQSREVVAQKTTVFTEPVGGDGYTEIVAAQSRALAALSREIAGAIRTAASH
ncbi:MAG: PqiC family protein [Gammaproteobacteria bacterium]